MPRYSLTILPVLLVALALTPRILIAQAKRDATYTVSPGTLAAMEKAAPDAPIVPPQRPRKVLVYGRVPTHPESVACCFQAIQILGKKTGAFEVVTSGNPTVFRRDHLEQFDVVLMNNTHERAPMLPWDFEQLDPDVQSAAKQDEAIYTRNLVDFVSSGKGLVGIHGATAIRDDLKELAEMYGGQIAGHRSGVWWVKPDEPAHPLCAPLGGTSFQVRDEIYVHRRPLTREPLTRQDVRVLLCLDLDKSEDPQLRKDGDYALSWIRPYGRGRVFYCTLGHAKTAYTNPTVMRHYLAGIQFAAGDLPADTAARP
jgi:type 1 glutamine amidotransferase